MTLRLHRAPRADLLVDGLADVLRTPQADPFAPELVIVPARGVERWVSQRLSHTLGAVGADGVCAGVEFRAPRSIVAEIVGSDADDPWAPDAMVWPLLEVVDASLGEPWCPALTRHLGHPSTRRPGEDPELRAGRRYSVAHRLARLFAGYATQRPTLLLDWEAGRPTDGAGAPLDPDLAWQAELWRRLVAHLGTASPAQRHGRVVEALAADASVSSLPSRLSLFGHTRIPVTEIELLAALAVHRDVDIWLPHPSDALWTALAGHRGTVPRADDATHLEVDHPLLATLGRDLRELQRTLVPVAATSVTLDVPRSRPATVLGHLQDDLEAARAPRVPRPASPGDRSVQVHACHGAARQVEVLREVVLGLLADDRTLEPRDVVVMCPDIESFAPLLESAFGLGGLPGTDHWHPGQQLQVRLADRSLVQTNPLLDVVGRLLAMAGGRVEASAVLDLATCGPVRRRFGFGDDDLEALGRWVRATGVRWAFDAEHRGAYGLQEYPQNTWRFGLDRMLAGVAVSADAQRYFGTALPFDDIGSSDIDLVGRVAEMLSRLQGVTDRLTGTRPVGEWVTALRAGLEQLTQVGHAEEWQAHQAERELAALDVARGTTTVLDLRLADVRALMSERLAGRPTRANFRTGTVTVCTMVPMRSVPHRVVCLLGLDDGTFPRASSVDGDDVLARRPLTGERDVRSEDRQLLLDAIMAATEHLVVTYAGADEVTGRTRPPSVPLGELLDALDLTVVGGRDAAVVRHPLQAFDDRNFRPGALGTGSAFSFDPAARAAAVRARRPAVAPPTLADLRLAPAPPGDVDLAQLGAFLRHPVREFLRRRLDLEVFTSDDEVLDAMPVELDSLELWGVGDRMLRDRLRGVDAHDALHMEWRRGILPPGRLGWRQAQFVSRSVEAITAAALASRDGRVGDSRDVDLDLGGGRRLRGTVADVHGDRVVSVGFSRVGARHHLDAWLPLLALTAAEPGTAWTSGAVGKGADGSDRVVLAGIGPTEAAAVLADLVDLYDLGMQQPLRLPLKTGFAMARRSLGSAEQEWSGKFPESDDRAFAAVWGPKAPFSVLTDGPDHQSLPVLARRLWTPILQRVAG